MRKELPKIIIIFLITAGLVFWALNFIFLGKAPKSKATGETISFFFDPTSVSQASGDFVTSVKIKPSVNMIIRGYQFEITFDKSKIQFKGIQYKTGAVSAGVGDDDSKTSLINQNGKIKVVGEIQSATGQTISAGQNTEIVAVTFTANSAQSSSIATGATDAKFFMIKTDYSLFDVPSAGQASFSVNTGEPTLTPAPTGTVTLNLKLKFQGISSKPADNQNSMAVKVKLKKEGETNPTEATGVFSADTNGIWSGKANFNLTSVSGKYLIYIKGPQHIQKKVCEAVPSETPAGTYSCSNPNISIQLGDNNLDFSKIIILVGDLDQSGIVDSVDISLVRNNLGKTDAATLAKADLNRDGVIDTQDFSLILAALAVRTDEQ